MNDALLSVDHIKVYREKQGGPGEPTGSTKLSRQAQAESKPCMKQRVELHKGL